MTKSCLRFEHISSLRFCYGYCSAVCVHLHEVPGADCLKWIFFQPIDEWYLCQHRATDEYGLHAFGRDYDRRTAEWISAHMHVCGAFGRAATPDREIGSGRFFIKAYCRD